MSTPLREPQLIPVEPRLATMRVLSEVVGGLFLIVLVGVSAVIVSFEMPWLVLQVLTIVLIVIFQVVIGFITVCQVKALGYKIRPTDLLIERGIMFRATTVVPYARMQYVDVTAGPFERMFGLATVTLHTASATTDASIPGLKRADADRLRELLSQRGQSGLAGL